MYTLLYIPNAHSLLCGYEMNSYRLSILVYSCQGNIGFFFTSKLKFTVMINIWVNSVLYNFWFTKSLNARSIYQWTHYYPVFIALVISLLKMTLKPACPPVYAAVFRSALTYLSGWLTTAHGKARTYCLFPSIPFLTFSCYAAESTAISWRGWPRSSGRSPVASVSSTGLMNTILLLLLLAHLLL